MGPIFLYFGLHLFILTEYGTVEKHVLVLEKKNAAKQDNAVAVCKSGMGMFFYEFHFVLDIVECQKDFFCVLGGGVYFSYSIFSVILCSIFSSILC